MNTNSIFEADVPKHYTLYFQQILAPGLIHSYVPESIKDVALLSDTLTYEKLVQGVGNGLDLIVGLPSRLPLPDYDEVAHFGRNLLKAARNVGMAITYLLIGVILPLVVGVMLFFSSDAGPYCVECINIGGNFYPTYSFWVALAFGVGGLMLLILGIRMVVTNWWQGSANRYHIIRAR